MLKKLTFLVIKNLSFSDKKTYLLAIKNLSFRIKNLSFSNQKLIFRDYFLQIFLNFCLTFNIWSTLMGRFKKSILKKETFVHLLLITFLTIVNCGDDYEHSELTSLNPLTIYESISDENSTDQTKTELKKNQSVHAIQHQKKKDKVQYQNQWELLTTLPCCQNYQFQ